MDKNLNNIAEGLLSEFGNLMQLADSTLSSIPNEAKELIPDAQMDIQNAKIMLNRGDTSGLTQILKKYADNTSK